MKKKLLGLLAVSCFALTLGACSPSSSGGSQGGGGGGGEVVTYYTVGFYVNDARYATARVKEGEKITQKITDPTPAEGFEFTGWYEGTTLVDLETYVVTHDARFDAGFEEAPDEGETLSVDDVKEAGQEYYAVFGWWETTAVDESTGQPKVTSGMTKPDIRRIYKNIRKYLTLKGATEGDLAKVQFRNYSSADVATMGSLINADEDVDVLFGVGNNINSSSGANVSLYNQSNDYKFQSRFGSANKDRYVACTSKASELGVALYEWLKFNNIDAGGYNSNVLLTDELTVEQVEETLPPETLGITVTIHGDTDAVTVLDKTSDPITLPTITVPEGYHFVGYALTADGEVVLSKALEAEITYDDIKSYVINNAVDLYPIFEANPVVEEDLVVYVQVNGSNLTMPEAQLLEARFNDNTDKEVKFNIIEGAAAVFKDAVLEGADADVIIGGNDPVNPSKGYFTAHEDGPVANCGAKHFASTNRKVIINGLVNEEHLDLAKTFYAFVTSEAPEFEVHATIWPKANNSWVSKDEIAAITAGMEDNLKTYLNVGEEATLLDKYNVKYTVVEVTTDTDAGKDKVEDLGNATRALREGKGTDLVIGCGANVTTTGGFTDAEVKDIPVSMVAAGRKVALVKDNGLTRNIFEKYFVELTQE